MQLASLDGGTVGVAESAVDELAKKLSGELLRAGSRGFDESRAIWNAWIDRKPGLIVRAARTADVAAAIRFANDHGVLLSVRAGGHNHVGFAVCDGGVMIDLTRMRSTRLEAETRRAVIGPGLTFADLDALTHQAGLATTGAIVSMVGVPGYTLGGGVGWLHRKAGAGCDNLISAEVVTATGDVVRTDEKENPELLWALRGGGGNFGVVTELGFRLHEVKNVMAGLLFHPLEDLEVVATFVDGFMDQAPDDLCVWMLHRKAPPSPALPAELHGRPVVIVAVTYAGPMGNAEKVVAPLRTFRKPLLDLVKPRPYPEWQRALDAPWGNGFHNEWVGHYLKKYDKSAMATMLDFISRVPSPYSDVKLARMGGAIGRVGENDTAFGMRDSRYALVIQARWENPEETDLQMKWTREFHAAMRAHGTGKVYSNFVGHEPEGRVEDAYNKTSYARLRALKAQLDPRNLFRMNVNIKPS
jgi:FAD/FMN-containing dehydrogenase